MLTRGDDYPVHQTPEPIAIASAERNFYDRYFFNGYSADGSLFFAAALGVYPQLGIIDAAFCLTIDGVQHNVRASRALGGERMDLTVGPIRVEVIEPLKVLRVVVEANDSPVRADLTFAARHAPIEEPRFTRRHETRLLMDYTRLTQNGGWSGSVTLGDRVVTVAPDTHWGTRDRSWGIRPVGAQDAQPAGGGLRQFWWLWMPVNFDDRVAFFHSNDDGEGEPWNRCGVIASLDGNPREFTAAIGSAYHPGTRRLASVQLKPWPGCTLVVTPRDEHFYMSGLGYLHPQWGHGMDRGDQLAVSYDICPPGFGDAPSMLNLHIQAMADAVLTIDGTAHRGVGVVEQLFIGPHAASGLTGLLDPAG